jgi:hypothetical protein
MSNNKPILVKSHITNQAEKFIKSQGGIGGRFSTVQEIINPGTVLTFIKFEKSMNQFVFKDQKDEEVVIYSSDVLVAGKDGMIPVPNTGLQGLLYNTNVYDMLIELSEIKENE